jgi:hypothetical protein
MNSVCKQFCSASASAASRCRASARIAKQVHLATQGDVCTRMLSSSLFIQSSSSVRWQAERSLQSQPSSSLLSLPARSKASAVLNLSVKTLALRGASSVSSPRWDRLLRVHTECDHLLASLAVPTLSGLSTLSMTGASILQIATHCYDRYVP